MPATPMPGDWTFDWGMLRKGLGPLASRAPVIGHRRDCDRADVPRGPFGLRLKRMFYWPAAGAEESRGKAAAPAERARLVAGRECA